MCRQKIALIFLLSAMTITVGCSTAPPVTTGPEAARTRAPDVYKVVRGDTLYAIAFRYDLDYKQVAEWNALASPDRIFAGQELRLVAPGRPGVPRAAPTGAQAQISPTLKQPRTPVEPPKQPPPSQKTVLSTPPPPAPIAKQPQKTDKRTVAGLSWRWPTEDNVVVQKYQPDVPGRKGIQISGRLGQPIKAASGGQVVYRGSGLPGYGRLIIVKHSDTLLSAYGYLGEIFVKEGDKVQQGQDIAKLGANNGDRPVLHFEIRQNGKPVNPLKFLPS